MRVLYLLFILFLMYFTKNLNWSNNPGMEMSLFFGFMIIGAFYFSKLLSKTNLPKVTLYTIFGIIIGPFILKFSVPEVISNLKFIDNFTLIIIALMAGSELDLKFIKKEIKQVLSITFLQIIFIFVAVFLTILFFGKHLLPFIADASQPLIIKVAIIMGLVGIAKSPLTTIAVIDETKAKGPFTEILLGIVIIKDVLMLLLFPIIFMIIGTGSSIAPLSILLEIVVSFLVGLLLGIIIKYYMKKIDLFLPLFLFILSFFVIEFEGMFHYDLLLVAIITGFYMRNFTDVSEQFSKNIKSLAFFVFIVFFTINGILLDLPILKQGWLSAFILLAIILIFNQLGIYFPAKLNRKRDPETSQKLIKFAWTAFINKSGLSIAIAIMVENFFPTIGTQLRTMIITMVIITDFIGPALFKWAIVRTGEGKIEN
ncbi:MAG: hypothetical protein GWP03_05545 [Proteobacteria bacterium]|nr:hypothetical protein [Pseudomonadota bacterium]